MLFCLQVGKTLQSYLGSTKALNLSLFARNRYGVMTEVNQTLKLEDTPKINNRIFDGGITAILNNTNTGTKYKNRLNTGTIFFINSELINNAVKRTEAINNFK